MSNFASILDKPATEIERPKPLPQGSYIFTINGRHREDVSSKKKTPFVEFTCKVLQAGEDVSEDDLTAFLTKADGSTKVLQDTTMKATYYTTEEAMFRLKDFLGHLGIDVDDGRSIRAMLDEAPGRQFLGNVKHRASEDGQSVFAELGNTAAVPE